VDAIFGVVSMLMCTISMFAFFLESYEVGKQVFGLSLLIMCLSLCISLWEVYISSNALNLELKDLDKKCK
jgi:Na+/phosphate symporter